MIGALRKPLLALCLLLASCRPHMERFVVIDKSFTPGGWRLTSGTYSGRWGTGWTYFSDEYTLLTKDETGKTELISTDQQTFTETSIGDSIYEPRLF